MHAILVAAVILLDGLIIKIFLEVTRLHYILVLFFVLEPEGLGLLEAGIFWRIKHIKIHVFLLRAQVFFTFMVSHDFVQGNLVKINQTIYKLS